MIHVEAAPLPPDLLFNLPDAAETLKAARAFQEDAEHR